MARRLGLLKLHPVVFRFSKGQLGCSVVDGADDDEEARQRRQDGQGFVHRRPDEGQHGRQEYKEGNSIQDDPELARVFRQRNAQKADDPVDR